MKKKKTIMVIDCDPDIVKNFQDYLERDGYTTIRATNVEQSILNVQKKSPDLIMMGVFTNKHKLLECVKKKNVKKKNVKILYIAEMHDKIEKEEMLKGSRNVLETPFDNKSLIKKIQGLIG